MKLRCYCCGAEILDDMPIVLVSPDTREVDRVFVMLAGHQNRVDGGSSEVVARKPYVQDLVDTVLDFSASIGNIALQDYGRFNRVLLESGKYVDTNVKATKKGGKKR